MTEHLSIATRGSRLALWQTNYLADCLRKKNPNLEIELCTIQTKGDQVTELGLSEIGGKGLFTAELETALAEKRCDLAVHSLKDLPTTLPTGFEISAFLERADVRDVLIMRRDRMQSVADEENTSFTPFDYLPENALFGTSSLRRQAQACMLRPDLEMREFRGNVDTRLRKIAESVCDGTILALAGLVRLGFLRPEHGLPSDGLEFHDLEFADEVIAFPLDPLEWLPAFGQGIIAVEGRQGDQRVLDILKEVDHQESRLLGESERILLAHLEGGCSIPAGVYSQLAKTGKLELEAGIFSPDGQQSVRSSIEFFPQEKQDILKAFSKTLKKNGGQAIMQELKQPNKS